MMIKSDLKQNHILVENKPKGLKSPRGGHRAGAVLKKTFTLTHICTTRTNTTMTDLKPKRKKFKNVTDGGTDGGTDGRTDGGTDGRMDGRTDGRTDRPTDRQTDRQSGL